MPQLSYQFHGGRLRQGKPSPTLFFAWDANAGGDNVTNYNLKTGTASGVYTTSINVGLATTYNLPKPGVQTFYAVTATNASGDSPVSNEIHSP